MNSWIRDFLKNRQQQVVLQGATSTSAPVQSGVPQVSVLGPLLFLLFINDLPEVISTGSTVRPFADDCVLYRRIRSTEDTNALQDDLNSLQNWDRDWLMEFHPEKSKVLHISNKRNPLKYNYNIHGHILEEAETSKYLGINLNRTLSWNNHINTVAKKASNISAFLQRNLHQLPRKSKAQCYQTLVRPLMEYACTIWDPHTKENINKLEAVQRRSARFVYNDQTHNQRNTNAE